MMSWQLIDAASGERVDTVDAADLRMMYAHDQLTRHEFDSAIKAHASGECVNIGGGAGPMLVLRPVR